MSATIETSPSSKQDADDLAAIDNALERMRTFTPTDPYILTIPQDVEPRYHHMYKVNATQWLHNTPFKAYEHESTQYQTFIYHEPGRDMFMLHNSQPGERITNGHKGDIATGSNTPSGNTAPKKKISLSAYKKKQSANATPDSKETEQAKQPAVKGPIERLKADEEVLAAVESGEDFTSMSVESNEKKDLKRKRDDSLSERKAVVNGVKELEAPPKDENRVKKPRRISPSPPATQEQPRTEQGRTDSKQSPTPPVKPISPLPNSSKDSILPPKLSPPPPSPMKSKLPPKLSPVEISSSLPARISPTLPNNILETLKARARDRSTSRSSELLGSRSASKDPATRHLTPPPKTVPRNGFRANSGSPAVRSDMEDRGRPAKPLVRESHTPDQDSEASEEIVVHRNLEKPKQQHPTPSSEKRSLLVKLKIKKAQRENVRRILALRPDPAKSSRLDREAEEAITVRDKGTTRPLKTSDARQRGQRDANAKGIAQKVGPANTTNGVTKKEESKIGASLERKRTRSDDSDDFDESSSKRKKTAFDSAEPKSHDPSTPTAQRPPSQPVSNTMRKDVLSAAMKREYSNDSVLGSNSQSQPSPSVQESHTSQPPNGTPQTTNRTRTPEEIAWIAEDQRLEQLGKDLKNAATDHYKTASASADPTTKLSDQKLAAIKSLEAFLSFIVAFICFDQARLASDPKLPPTLKTWRTLQGFYGFVKRHCEPFPHLYGLACALVMVSCARILELATQQQRPSSSSEAADGAPQWDISPDHVLGVAAQMQRAANDADAKLDVDVLQTAFPKAWAAREKGGGAVEKEIWEVGKSFAGPYKLPIGLHTSPLRAARAGYALLEEWIALQSAGEGGYVMKLKL